MREWQRIDSGPLPSGSRRDIAEEETRRDLQKPIEQLLCDVHEESHDPGRSQDENTGGAVKRMVSLMARVAIENERASRHLLVLTWVLAILTVAILWLTVMMWMRV